MSHTACVAAPPRHDPALGERLRALVDGVTHPTRSPVLHRPDEYGLDYTDVVFPSADGVPLEGWFVPAPGSDRLVVMSHPMGFSRSGHPAHDDAVEIDFVRDHRILHEAGYNVLSYDLRNHGWSGAANGGLHSSGIFESRDVLGSLAWVRSRPETRDMAVGLFGRGLGCDATFHAMTVDPGAFDGVRCLLACNPVTGRMIDERVPGFTGVPSDRLRDVERLLVQATGLDHVDRDTRAWARGICVPTFFYGVLDDVLTDPEDLEAMYVDASVADKRLQWVLDRSRRWDGYLEFQRNPEPMLDWLGERLA